MVVSSMKIFSSQKVHFVRTLKSLFIQNQHVINSGCYPKNLMIGKNNLMKSIPALTLGKKYRNLFLRNQTVGGLMADLKGSIFLFNNVRF